MRFFVAAAISALATLVAAKAAFTNSAFDVEEGTPFTLTWTNATGAVTLGVQTGPQANLKPVLTIASGITDTSYTWTPSGLASGTYNFVITDSTGVPNYSIQFTYVGTGSSSSSSASSTSSTSASSTSTTSTTSTETSTSTSTTASSTSSRTSTSTSSRTSSTSTSTSTPANTNNGQRLASSLALVLVGVAALVCFN